MSYNSPTVFNRTVTCKDGIQMGGSKISSLGTPTEPGDAVTKTYVDTNLRVLPDKVLLSGDTMSGRLTINTFGFAIVINDNLIECKNGDTLIGNIGMNNGVFEISSSNIVMKHTSAETLSILMNDNYIQNISTNNDKDLASKAFIDARAIDDDNKIKRAGDTITNNFYINKNDAKLVLNTYISIKRPTYQLGEIGVIQDINSLKFHAKPSDDSITDKRLQIYATNALLTNKSITNIASSTSSSSLMRKIDVDSTPLSQNRIERVILVIKYSVELKGVYVAEFTIDKYYQNRNEILNVTATMDAITSSDSLAKLEIDLGVSISVTFMTFSIYGISTLEPTYTLEQALTQDNFTFQNIIFDIPSPIKNEEVSSTEYFRLLIEYYR